MMELPPPFACKTCTSLREGGIIGSLFEGAVGVADWGSA